MANPNGSSPERDSLSDFEEQLRKLRSQHLDEEEITEAEAETVEELPVNEEPFEPFEPQPEEVSAESAAQELPAEQAEPAPYRPAPAAPARRSAREQNAPAGAPRQRRPRSAPQPQREGPPSFEEEMSPSPKRPVRKSAPRPAPIEEEEDDKPRKKNPVTGFFRFLGRSLVTILLTVLVLVIALGAAITIVCRGPSTAARRLFVLSTNETSALKSVPRYFLSDDIVDSILHPPVEEVEPDSFVELQFEAEAKAKEEQGEQALVTVDTEAANQELEVINIKGGTFKGKMLIIHDPKKVLLASLEQFGDYGIFLTEFIERHGAVAGTNAGGFYDPDGMGNGGTPDGLVIRDGKLAYGSLYSKYVDVIGFDANRILHCGDMTAQEALDMGIVEAISFSAGPVLIQDGVKRTGLGGGVNPRTCIGQRADGAVLLMVVEGRHPDSLGATYDDLANLMEEYGAVNAGNLDGGSSSAMIYNGEQITKGSTIIGSRRMATAILVLP